MDTLSVSTNLTQNKAALQKKNSEVALGEQIGAGLKGSGSNEQRLPRSQENPVFIKPLDPKPSFRSQPGNIFSGPGWVEVDVLNAEEKKSSGWSAFGFNLPATMTYTHLDKIARWYEWIKPDFGLEGRFAPSMRNGKLISTEDLQVPEVSSQVELELPSVDPWDIFYPGPFENVLEPVEPRSRCDDEGNLTAPSSL